MDKAKNSSGKLQVPLWENLIMHADLSEDHTELPCDLKKNRHSIQPVISCWKFHLRQHEQNSGIRMYFRIYA